MTSLRLSPADAAAHTAEWEALRHELARAATPRESKRIRQQLNDLYEKYKPRQLPPVPSAVTRFDAFSAALTELCREHGVVLCADRDGEAVEVLNAGELYASPLYDGTDGT